jgi:two-component system, NarL family, response regulator NreC
MDCARYTAATMGVGQKTRARILLVDDFEVVRRGLKNLLARNGHWEVCGEAENGWMAIEKVAELSPDLVLLDVTMPVMNGFQATTEIRRRAPHTKIVIFTMHESPRMAEEARRAGADAYLAKSASLETIESTISNLLDEDP